MAGKSDFAQKLLHDLKLRKERMAASTQSSHSRDHQGSTSGTYRNAQKPQTGSRTTVGSRRANANAVDSSSKSQIVVYDKGGGGGKKANNSSPQQVNDLSMAIAFAFENNGNLSKIGVHSSNPLVNFFNRFTRRSSSSSKNGKNLELASVGNVSGGNNGRGVTTFELSNVSHIHIDEISKGVQKLNQILRACSNGDSAEVGKELLKGAMDLEESLKLLVGFQESSGKKSDRIRLLEVEGEEDDDGREVYSGKKPVDRPRFSFDKQPKNKPCQKLLMLPYHEDAVVPRQGGNDFKVGPHKRSTSCVPEFSALACSPAREMGKISNVIAKLMGLEEMPQKEDGKDSKKNERKESNVSRQKRDELSDRSNGNNKIAADVITSNEKPEKRPRPKDLGKNEKKHGSITEAREGKVRVLIEQKVPADEKVKEERIPRKIDEEKRKLTTDDVMRDQPMAHDKKPKGSEDKNDNTKKRAKQSHQKHSSTERRRKANQMESMKVKQGSQNLQKKQILDDKFTRENVKPGEEMSENTASDKVKAMKQEINLTSVATEGSKVDEKVISNGLPLEKHVDDRSQISKKNAVIQKNENPRKIDVLPTRRNGALANHPTRSSKHSANMLQDLKQRMDKKKLSSKMIGQQNQDSAGEAVEEVIREETHPIEDEGQRAKDEAFEPLDQRERLKEHDDQSSAAGDCKESIIAPKKRLNEPLTVPEKEFKEVIIKDQLFLNTAEALYKLNLPLTFLQAQDHQNNEASDKKLLSDCGYEVMKRNAMREEHSLHPFKRGATSLSKVRSLDDLVKQLCKGFDTLRVYGGGCKDEEDVAGCLYRMLDKDIRGKYPDVNCMWDHRWNMVKTTIFSEVDEVVRDVEKHMINGLLDEITGELVVPVILAV